MKDAEIRGHVLQLLYDQRRLNRPLAFNFDGGDTIPDGFEMRDWIRACLQLCEYGLIDWELQAINDDGVQSGYAQITAAGTDVVEEEGQAPIAITFDQSQHVLVSHSHSVQVAGAGSHQAQTIESTFEYLVDAVDRAQVTPDEKKNVRSLLLKLAESKAFASILQAGTGALIDRLRGS